MVLRMTTGIGIIGCGNISAAYLRSVAAFFPELAVVGVADRDEGRAAARAAEFGVRAMRVDALLADPAVAIVVNLTTPQGHVPVGLAAVRAGKHVHGEKPLALSVDEGRTLLAAAGAAGVRVGTAPDTFLGGGQQTARRLVDEGAIGRPLSGTAFMMNHGHEHWHPDPGFYYAPGGGPLFDMGPYYLTALVNLLGPVARVAGSAGAGFEERETAGGAKVAVAVATHVAGLLEFEGGAVVTLVTSFDVWQHRHGPIELYGTEGSLTVPDPNRFGGTVSLARRREAWTDVPLSHGFADGNFRGIGVADLARAVAGGRAARCDGALGLHVLEVMEALHRSSEERRFVTIETRCERPAPLPARPAVGQWE